MLITSANFFIFYCKTRTGTRMTVLGLIERKIEYLQNAEWQKSFISITHMPHIDIQILVVSRMFVP